MFSPTHLRIPLIFSPNFHILQNSLYWLSNSCGSSSCCFCYCLRFKVQWFPLLHSFLDYYLLILHKLSKILRLFSGFHTFFYDLSIDVFLLDLHNSLHFLRFWHGFSLFNVFLDYYLNISFLSSSWYIPMALWLFASERNL